MKMSVERQCTKIKLTKTKEAIQILKYNQKTFITWQYYNII